MMQAIEIIGQVDAKGRLLLENLPVSPTGPVAVKVLVLYPDSPNNLPPGEMTTHATAAPRQARNHKRLSLDELWEELEKG